MASAFALELETKNKKLDAILTALDRDDRKAQSTVVRKQDAIEVWDDKYLRLARFFESFWRMAELDEKAKRFRPTVRQVGRPLRDELDLGDSEGDGDDDGETTAVASTDAVPDASQDPAAGAPAANDPSADATPQGEAPETPQGDVAA